MHAILERQWGDSIASPIMLNRKGGKYLEYHYVDTGNCFDKVAMYKYYAWVAFLCD